MTREGGFIEYRHQLFRLNEIKFQGARLEAKDHMGEQWWEAKVKEK